jgi:small-conductance mechanosensitive channel
VTVAPTFLSRLSACLILCLALFAALPGLPAHAQAQPAASALADQRSNLTAYTKQADGLERQMKANAEADGQLVDIRNQLDTLSRQLLASSVALRPRISEINTRLDQIGPPPGDSEPAEPEVLTKERAALQQEKAEINALLGEAEALSLRLGALIEQIAQMRRDLFSSQLSRRYDIGSALNAQVLADFAAEVSDVYGRFSAWISFAVRFKLSSLALAAFFALLAAAVLLIGGRRAFGRLLTADASVAKPSYLGRLSVAFWSTLLPSLALAVFFAATYFFLGYFNVLRSDIAQILGTLFNVIATVYFINRLAGAAFSPQLPNWRLVPVETAAAWKLYFLVGATSIVTGADFVLTKINTVVGSPLSLTIAKSLVATVIVGILIVLIGAVKPLRDADGKARHWPAALRYPMLALGLATIAAAVLGYIGLARFMSQQIVVTGAILATMYIGHLSAQALAKLGAFRQSVLGKRLEGRLQLDGGVEDQIGLAASILIHVIVVAIGVPLILLQWGFQWGDITTWALGIAREIRVGSISFSLVGIATGIVVFLLGYFLTRWFQSWLDGSVMTRGRVDAGVRNSIRTVVGYSGVAIAALIGLSAAGISLSSLALVAGGLSLGIGFGLQNIVQNFVSGLILLAERPFKVGDWIVAGGTSGIVKKISVRATQIETFQRQMVILPNSELINASVGNWTHRNRLARTEVRITAAYGADARKVQALLLELARAQPMVLKNPEPFVALVEISNVGLEFELRVFLADVYDSGTVQNDLRFAILEVFEREGIAISYAARSTYHTEPHAEPAAAEPALQADAAGTKKARAKP